MNTKVNLNHVFASDKPHFFFNGISSRDNKSWASQEITTSLSMAYLFLIFQEQVPGRLYLYTSILKKITLKFFKSNIYLPRKYQLIISVKHFHYCNIIMLLPDCAGPFWEKS